MVKNMVLESLEFNSSLNTGDLAFLSLSFLLSEMG